MGFELGRTSDCNSLSTRKLFFSIVAFSRISVRVDVSEEPETGRGSGERREVKPDRESLSAGRRSFFRWAGRPRVSRDITLRGCMSCPS